MPGRRFEQKLETAPRNIFPTPFKVSHEEAALRRKLFRGLPDAQKALVGIRYTSASEPEFEPVWAMRTIAARPEKCFFCPQRIPAYTPHTLFVHPPMELDDRTYSWLHFQQRCFSNEILHSIKNVVTLPHEDARRMINKMLGDPTLATQERMAELLGAVALELGVE